MHPMEAGRLSGASALAIVPAAPSVRRESPADLPSAEHGPFERSKREWDRSAVSRSVGQDAGALPSSALPRGAASGGPDPGLATVSARC